MLLYHTTFVVSFPSCPSRPHYKLHCPPPFSPTGVFVSRHPKLVLLLAVRMEMKVVSATETDTETGARLRAYPGPASDRRDAYLSLGRAPHLPEYQNKHFEARESTHTYAHARELQ